MGGALWISTCPLHMERQTDVQTYSSNYNIDIGILMCNCHDAQRDIF